MFGPLHLAVHDPEWGQEFEQTRSSLLQAAWGDLVRVEHVGATAIDGLPAQPVIDVAAVTHPDADLDEVGLRIEGLNFRRLEDVDGVRRYVKPRHGAPTHQVFLCAPGDEPWVDEAVQWRDAQRTDCGLRARVASFKQHLVESFPDDGAGYEAGKSHFRADALVRRG